MIQGNFFLGSSTIVLAAYTPKTKIQGVIITGNVFHTSNSANSTFVLDETRGTFTGVVDTIIENNEVGAVVKKAGKFSTRATQSVQLSENTSTTTLEFNQSLLFGGVITIDLASVECQLHGGEPAGLSSAVLPGTKTVEVYVDKELRLGSSVTCTVDQSSRGSAAH
jgi:hypothetical protein